MEAKPGACLPSSLCSEGMGIHLGLASQGYHLALIHKEGGRWRIHAGSRLATSSFRGLWCNDVNDDTYSPINTSTIASNRVCPRQLDPLVRLGLRFKLLNLSLFPLFAQLS